MARKRLTTEEKIARLEARLEAYQNGEVREVEEIQVPFADYLMNDGGTLRVIKFPKRAKDVKHYVMVKRGDENFKVWLRASKAGQGIPIPASVAPTVEFPNGIAYREQSPSFFGTVAVECESKQSAGMVIGAIARELNNTAKKNADLQASLAEFAERAKTKGK